MEKLNEEIILEEIMEKCNEEEKLIVKTYKGIFIKTYNIGRINSINKIIR